MKKNIYCLALYIISFFFVATQEVTADSTDYKISYDITYFNVSKIKADGDATMTIKGWSFLDHMDNYGGEDGNLTTWIVAYTGEWNDSWKYQPAKDTGNCKKSGKCWGFKANEYKTKDNNVIDLYYVRCIGSGCSYKATRENAIRPNKLSSINLSSISTSCNGGDSHCVYYNVGFQVAISLNELESKLGSNKDIKFRIVTRAKYKNARTYYIDSTGLGILPSSCSRVLGIKCNSNGTYTKTRKTSTTVTENGVTITKKKKIKKELTIGGIDNTVKMTAGSALRFLSGDPDNYNYSGTFTEGGTYTVSSITSIKTFHRASVDQHTFLARRLLLNDGAWAYSPWVKFNGELHFKVKTTPTEETTKLELCPDSDQILCFGGNCDGETIPSISSVAPKSCSSNIQEYQNCDNKTYSNLCEQTIESTYYYLIDINKLEEWCINDVMIDAIQSNFKMITKNEITYYYIPVHFYTNVVLSQTAKVNIYSNFVNGKLIHAGRSFDYSLGYDVSANWNYLGEYLSTTTQNNTYNALGVLVGTDPDGDHGEDTYYIWLKDGDTLYGEDLTTTYTYNSDFYKQIAKNGVKNYLQEFNTAENYVTFPDSNNAESNITVKNAGSNQCSQLDTANWEAGVEKSVSCTYKINQAYLKNDGSGHTKYEETDGYYADPTWTNNTSHYYLPINLKTDSIFKFQPNFTSLSLIKLITNKYTPTCNVKVLNEFEKESGCLTYRTIDTNNPFPTAGNDSSKMPYNWSEYVKNTENGLIRITDQSFSGISYQTKKVNNSIKNYISTLNKNYIYASYDDIKNNQSVIIHDESTNSIFEKINSKLNENRCEVGKYERSICDNVQGN